MYIHSLYKLFELFLCIFHSFSFIFKKVCILRLLLSLLLSLYKFIDLLDFFCFALHPNVTIWYSAIRCDVLWCCGTSHHAILPSSFSRPLSLSFSKKVIHFLLCTDHNEKIHRFSPSSAIWSFYWTLNPSSSSSASSSLFTSLLSCSSPSFPFSLSFSFSLSLSKSLPFPISLSIIWRYLIYHSYFWKYMTTTTFLYLLL